MLLEPTRKAENSYTVACHVMRLATSTYRKLAAITDKSADRKARHELAEGEKKAEEASSPADLNNK